MAIKHRIVGGIVLASAVLCLPLSAADIVSRNALTLDGAKSAVASLASAPSTPRAPPQKKAATSKPSSAPAPPTPC